MCPERRNDQPGVILLLLAALGQNSLAVQPQLLPFDGPHKGNLLQNFHRHGIILRPAQSLADRAVIWTAKHAIDQWRHKCV